MGAGIAAGPHCPGAKSLPGRRGVPRWAFSSPRRRNRGFPRRFLRSPSFGRSRFPVSPPAPRQGRSPGGSPLGRPELASRSHLFGILAEAKIPEKTGSSAEASVPPDGPWAEALGPAGFRSSRAEARSCPAIRSRSSSSPVAAREPKSRFRRAGPEPEGSGPACGLQACPKAAWSPCGRLTKHAAFASAKGQARSFRLAAASSAALPPLSPASRPKAAAG